MKQITVTFILNIPNNQPIEEAARDLETLETVAGFTVEDADIQYDPDDDISYEQAAWERREYERDMMAAHRM